MENLNSPVEHSILPNAMLNHSDILKVVMNIKNMTLKKEMLSKQDINYTASDLLFNVEAIWGKTYKIGDFVLLKLDVLRNSERFFQITKVE